jgi:hypothetical protein
MKMAFTPTNVNDWLFTIAGLDPANGNTQPVPPPFLGQYVTELNPVPPATTPVATPAEIQANLENFPFNPGTPPPNNIITDTFYRTTVADFVLREFQLAWGVVPTSGAATSQYDAWVARVINNPANMTAGGMSQALAGTTNFTLAIGATSATQPATIGMINALCANAGIPVGAGAAALVGTPIWQVLQDFATSSVVIKALAAPIANFQNLLLNAAPGAAPPAGNILTLSGSPGANLTLTTGIDTTTTGFSGGHGAQATAAGAVFLAPAGANVLGLSNTLNAGDDLVATGAALGNATLNYTAVASPTGNPALAVGVTMTGVNAAIITNLNAPGVQAGFSGTITGLTTVTLTAADTGPVTLGTAGNGLNTALTNVNVNAGHNFTAHMTAAALAAAPAGTVNVNGGVATVVALDSPVTTGYASLTVNSTGPGGATTNDLTLNLNGGAGTTNTATLTVTGAEALVISGSALNIDNLHTFNANGNTTPTPPVPPDTGGVDATFTNADGLGLVAATGGSGVNTFTFDDTAAGLASFTSASTVNGGSGATNTLGIQADTGAILLAGVGAGITGIATIEHTTAGVQTGNLTADLSQMGSATTFDLAGTYSAVAGTTVTVSDITNAQTVEFSGTGGFVTLNHAAPVVATDVINIEMDGTGPGPVTIDQLTVAAGLTSVNISSIGSASDNVISDISLVANNINISGGTHLTLGSDTSATGYQVVDGVINAGTDTGGVHVSLGNVGGAATGLVPVQTFTAGTGTNIANVFSGNSVLIDFSKGGTDTVEFSGGTETGNFPIANVAPLIAYNQVVGFTNANSNVHINTAFIPTAYTDTGLAVVGGDPTAASNFTGVSQVLTGQHINFIDFANPANFAGDTPQAAFNTAIGANTIAVAATATPYLFSLYDTATSQAILGTVTETGGTIATGDTVNVVGLLHMSAADYTAANGATFASHVHFV